MKQNKDLDYPMEPTAFKLIRPTKAPYLFGGAIIALVLGLSGFILTMTFAPAFVRFLVTEKGIVIKGDLYGRTIAWKDMKTHDARPFVKEKANPLRPVSRSNGLALPNYQSGWFKLQNGEKGLLFVSDWSKAVHVPTHRGYHLIVSPDDPARFIESITNQTPQAGPFAIAQPLHPNPGGWVVYLPIAFVAGIGFFLVWILRSISRTSLIVGPDALQIKAALYGRTLPSTALLADEIQKIDLKADRTYRGMLRTNGVGLPGFFAGWFRKSRGERFLLFVTRQTSAVLVPTNQGFSLVVSPEEPDRFIELLKQSARPGDQVSNAPSSAES